MLLYKIKNYPGYYCTEDGQIYSAKTKRFLKSAKNSSGYLYVILYKDSKRIHCLVHRLVAETFLLNLENKPYIDHLDTNKENNCVSNLRWVTRKENQNNPLSKINMRNTSKNKSVKQYDLNGVFIKEFISTKEAQRQTGVDQSHICKCCNGKYKTAGNYKWSY